MSRRLTYEQVKDFIEDKGCKLISTEYLNNRSPLDIQCSCGNTFTTIFDSFKNCNVRTCSECAEKIRKAPKPREGYSQIKKFIEIDSNSNCILLTDKQDYKTKKQKLSLLCSCGNPFLVSFENFKRRNKQKCNECSDLERFEKGKLSYKIVKEFIEGSEGNGCKLISTEYINTITDLEIQCACGKKYKCNFNHFLDKSQRQCKSCGMTKGGLKHRIKINFMSKYVEKNSDCKLVTTVLNDYKDPITFICKCGKPFTEQFRSFVKSEGKCCPSCNRKKPSKGERAVYKYLYENNINFIEQHSFPDCKNIIALQFDFAVLDDNSTIMYLIEYDGSLHYTTTEFFGGEKRLFLQQKRDRIKDKYCLDNGIPLIRIPYWDFDNIDSILDKELKIIRKEVGKVDIA